MKLSILVLWFALFIAATAATLYRNSSVDVSGVDYGLTPANAPIPGDVLSATASGTAWVTLTNFVHVWSGTSGGLLVPINSTYYLPPSNSSSNLTLFTSDTAGATRCPVTRAVTLQNLYVIASPAPGSGKSTVISVTTNGVASSIVATVSGTATNANDTTHSVTVAAGTEVGVKIVTSASSTAGKVAWSFEAR